MVKTIRGRDSGVTELRHMESYRAILVQRVDGSVPFVSRNRPGVGEQEDRLGVILSTRILRE
jgi:hypothetical protein